MADMVARRPLCGALQGRHYSGWAHVYTGGPDDHGAAMATHPIQALTRAPVDLVDALSLSDSDRISVQVRGPADAHYLEGGAAPVDPDTGHVQRSGGWAYFTVESSDAIWYWTTGGSSRIVVSSG